MSVPRWIPDNSTRKCFGCNVEFSFLLRRHHCRNCGRIFCANCTQHAVVIPDKLLLQAVKTPPRSLTLPTLFEPAKERRVCDACTEKIERSAEYDRVVDVLVLLAPWGVGPSEWSALNDSGKDPWLGATNILLTAWQSIQHIMPYQRASPFQKKLLEGCVQFMSPAHVVWDIVATRENLRIPRRTVQLSCADMGCDRQCSRIPPCVAAIVSLVFGARDMAIVRLQNVNDPTFVRLCFVNILAAAANRDNYLIADVFVPLAQKSGLLAVMLYFAARARCPALADTFHQYLSLDCQRIVSRTESWIASMRRLAVCPEEERDCAADFDAPAVLPNRPDVEVVRILHANIMSKRSSSNPTVIPCQCRRVGEQQTFVQCYLFKTEDVRPDACVVELTRLMALFLELDAGTPFEHVAYDVMPLSPTDGIVTLVPGARTLYSLHNDRVTLQNWVMDNNQHLSVHEMKSRFLRSCAFATTMSMLLGFGDRHLENILLTKQGVLFHCDFSHVCGQEPSMKSLVGNTMRITSQMVDFLGGKNSTYYKRFTHACGHIYNTARRWAVPVYACMMALVYDSYCSPETLQRIVETVFCPGESPLQACIKIEDRVNRESGGRLTDRLVDTVHHLFAAWRY